MTPQMKQLTEWSNMVSILMLPLIGYLTNSKNLVVFVIVFTGLILVLKVRDAYAVACSIVVMILYPFIS